MQKIIFTDILTNNQAVDKPKPASEFIPDWYKKIESYMTGKKMPNEDGSPTSTVKKCMPVFDAITAGYIITSPCDVYVRQKDGTPYFTWVAFNAIEFHPISQTTGHPASKDGLDSPKWMNPWAVKTPKGYSTLFMSPAHQDLPFVILPGIVDTDTYTHTVNFPFKLIDPAWEGMIPAGTPIAQVIPIKREKWKMELGSEKEIKEINAIDMKFNTVFFDRYKRFWWNKKEYK